MTDETVIDESDDVQDANQDPIPKAPTEDTKTNQDSKDLDAAIAKAVEEKLQDIKSKLDKAYGARDDALKRVAEYEQKEKEERQKRMEEEGKHKELYEEKLADLNAKLAALESRNTELSRDLLVKDKLKTFEFRSDKAFEMAYKEIKDNLVKKDDTGEWVHKSGTSLADFIESFSKDESNSFLFKQKTSSGPGIGSTKPTTSSSKKSLYEMSTEELLKMAEEGRLPHQR